MLSVSKQECGMPSSPHHRLTIEVAYAPTADEQVILSFTVAPGTTMIDAIKQSGILTRFPEINVTQQSVGIFSEKKPLSHIVQSGDRIEIYRALRMDPMAARRRRGLTHQRARRSSQ
jgi:putative ubiquitin-RnfH superfamily antitoxin RatB of RatAB toxin-antitoxin module